jgi:hypothetical protein
MNFAKKLNESFIDQCTVGELIIKLQMIPSDAKVWLLDNKSGWAQSLVVYDILSAKNGSNNVAIYYHLKSDSAEENMFK